MKWCEKMKMTRDEVIIYILKNYNSDAMFRYQNYIGNDREDFISID